ncbi:MAG: hypothetical protein WDN47_03660 [Candidatus Doudnabacteria bacterium]
MDLDIIFKIKFPQLKASFTTLALKHKLVLIVLLVSLSTTVIPHVTYAADTKVNQPDIGPLLVFDLSDASFNDYLDMRSLELSDQYYQAQIRQQAMRQQELTSKVRTYLQEQRSPLAEYASTLVTLRNWKQIVALSNAESSMCLHYHIDTSNCWGVGGTSPWNMGTNLGDGVITMNHFLNKYPLHSPIKYAQMSFEQMNGLYKQPPADHWVANNRTVYDDLVSIENNL